MKRILIIDDEPNIGRSLKLILEREGYSVAICGTCGEARAYSNRVDAYMLDVRLPDGSGIDLLRHLRQTGADAPVVMISGHGTIADAVEATRAGAFDFLEKPLARDRVLLALKNALEQSVLREENQRLREMVGTPSRMIGASPAWQRVMEQATMAARSDARVLLMGESGTGQGVARIAYSREQSLRLGSVRESELRGYSDGTHRERVVRAREGCVHGRSHGAPRQI